MSQLSRPLGKIGVLIEAHFDEIEFRRYNEVFPAHGFAVEYLSRLWGQEQLTFKGNDGTAEVTVTQDVDKTDPAGYRGIILIGGYAMDRLRYQEHVRAGAPNRAPAVEFLRRVVRVSEAASLKVGAVCHGLWLFCSAPELLRGRRVTCAHNIMDDVANAGGELVYDGEQLVDVQVDGNLITGRHPGVVDAFLEVLLAQVRRDNR